MKSGELDSGNRNADLTKGSLAGKQSVAKTHLLPFFGTMRLSKIDSALRLSDLSMTKRASFAHWTARRHKNLVKQVFDFAVNNGWLQGKPANEYDQ